MACSDCDGCSKTDICTQEYSYTCPFNNIKEGLIYMNVLVKLKNNLENNKKEIEIVTNDSSDLNDIKYKINSLLDEIDDFLNEDLVEEYKKLYPTEYSDIINKKEKV